jgi:hypothetical protein
MASIGGQAHAEELPFDVREVPRSVMAVIEPAPASVARRRAPATVYLNRRGATFSPGEPNDSRRNVSSVPTGTVAIPGWEADAADWTATRACIAEVLAPFAFHIVEEDPGDSPHLEVVFGGTPSQIGATSGAAGVSPFYSDCSVVDDSIVFIFPSVVGGDPRLVCETVAQEIGHSFGLDHQLLCDDPMSYMTGCGAKAFRDVEAPCGEFTARDCRCSQTQNSAQMLLDRVGPGRTGSGLEIDDDERAGGGCRAAGGAGSWLALVVGALALLGRRRRVRKRP